MASITARTTTAGEVWRVQHRVNGRLRERTFRLREDAESYARTLSQPTADPRHGHVVEEAEFMLSCGRGLAYVAEAYRIAVESVERACYRAGRRDLIERDRRLSLAGGA